MNTIGKKDVKYWIKWVFLFFLPLLMICAFIIFPYVWTCITSLKSSEEMFTAKVVYWPANPSFNNYKNLLGGTDFLKSMWNSLSVGLLSTLLAIIVSTMAGYVFSRYRFRGSKMVLGGVLLLYMFPQVLFLTPLYVTFKSLGLLGNVYSLCVAYVTTTIPFAIWLMAGFISDIPYEMEEAAKIDGANTAQSFVRIIVPLLRPGMVAAGSYIFINCWNEYLYAVMFTSSSNRTLPVALSSFIAENRIRWDLLTAGGIVAVVPATVLFFLVQKQLVSGLTAGSVKG